jgi:HSP20 family protein
MNDLFPLTRLQDEMSDVFGGIVEDAIAGRGYGAAYPGVNVWEDGDAAFIEAELPGMSMDDVDVDVIADEVTIRGERKIEDPSNGVYRRRERAAGCFSRTVGLPWEIDAGNVEANLRDGILTIRLPKSPAAKPRKIPVKTA